VLLDRRAAHERVWFEELQAQFRTGAVPSQRLLLPVPVELDPIAAALCSTGGPCCRNAVSRWRSLGAIFSASRRSPRGWSRAGPSPSCAICSGWCAKAAWPGKNPDLAREEVARLATAKALRLPENPGEAELQALAARLFATRHPLTNPAGRPTYIEISHGMNSPGASKNSRNAGSRWHESCC
jgi:DNA mismatch repair protein MutL